MDVFVLFNGDQESQEAHYHLHIRNFKVDTACCQDCWLDVFDLKPFGCFLCFLIDFPNSVKRSSWRLFVYFPKGKGGEGWEGVRGWRLLTRMSRDPLASCWYSSIGAREHLHINARLFKLDATAWLPFRWCCNELTLKFRNLHLSRSLLKDGNIPF